MMEQLSREEINEKIALHFVNLGLDLGELTRERKHIEVIGSLSIELLKCICSSCPTSRGYKENSVFLDGFFGELKNAALDMLAFLSKEEESSHETRS